MVSKVREVRREKTTVLFVLLSGLRIGGNNSRAISLGTLPREPICDDIRYIDYCWYCIGLHGFL